MRRQLALAVAMIFAMLGPHGGVASAQTVATPTPSGELDLAAMTLSPSDLAGVGLSGFGLANRSSLRDAETDALVESAGDVFEAGDRLAAYEDAGFMSRYVGSLLRPRVPLVRYPSGLVAADIRVSTSVTEYASEAGAVSGYSFVADDQRDFGDVEVPTDTVFGDQSRVERSTGLDPESGDFLQRLDITFQLDNLVAEVSILDYLNVEPNLAVGEHLAHALRAKIESVRTNGGPGLSQQVLRLTPLFTWIEAGRLRDFYVRQAGMDEPTFGELASAIREQPVQSTPPQSIPVQTAEQSSGLVLRHSAPPQGADLQPRLQTFQPATPAATSGLAEPRDTYMFWTPVGEGDPVDLPLFVTWLDRYQTPQEAAAAVDELTEELGPGYADVHESIAAERVGERSRQFAYRFEGDPTGAVTGHLVVAQVGNIVIRTQADGPTGVDAGGVRALASDQADCLRAGGPCQPMSALRALALLVDSASRFDLRWANQVLPMAQARTSLRVRY